MRISEINVSALVRVAKIFESLTPGTNVKGLVKSKWRKNKDQFEQTWRVQNFSN